MTPLMKGPARRVDRTRLVGPISAVIVVIRQQLQLQVSMPGTYTFHMQSALVLAYMT